MIEHEQIVLTEPRVEPLPSMPPALKKLDMNLPEDRPLGMNRAQRRRSRKRKRA